MKQLTKNFDTIAYTVTAIVFCFPLIPMFLSFPYSDYRTSIGHIVGDVTLYSVVLCWMLFPLLAMLTAIVYCVIDSKKYI